MPPERPEGLWGEIVRLRDWRHDEVEPRLAAYEKTLEFLRGRGDGFERRLTALEERMQAMAESEKIGQAVAAAMQKQHGGSLTRRQRLVGYLVALAAVVGAVIQVVHALT